MLQLTDEALAAAISCRPAVVWLAFPDVGRDFAAFVPLFKEAGCRVLCMVQTLDQAEEVVRFQSACLCNACGMTRPKQGSDCARLADCYLTMRFEVLSKLNCS